MNINGNPDFIMNINGNPDFIIKLSGNPDCIININGNPDFIIKVKGNTGESDNLKTGYVSSGKEEEGTEQFVGTFAVCHQAAATAVAEF